MLTVSANNLGQFVSVLMQCMIETETGSEGKFFLALRKQGNICYMSGKALCFFYIYCKQFYY